MIKKAVRQLPDGFFFYIFEILKRGVPIHGLRSYPLNLMQFILPKGQFHDSILPASSPESSR